MVFPARFHFIGNFFIGGGRSGDLHLSESFARRLLKRRFIHSRNPMLRVWNPPSSGTSRMVADSNVWENSRRPSSEQFL